MGHPAEKIIPAPYKEDIPLCSVSECKNIAVYMTLDGIPYCKEHCKEE